MFKRQGYKYLDIITVVFVLVLVLSNLVASIKVARIDLPEFEVFGWQSPKTFSFGAGLLIFPISYLMGDILTEVYGYARSRKVIWTGFIALIASAALANIFVAMPADPNWGLQDAYEQVFSLSWRVTLASFTAYFCGEFCNSYVVAKLKVLTKGKKLFYRLIGSTVVGEFVDTLIFYPIAFLGLTAFPTDLLIKVMIANYIVKVLWEVAAYPATRKLVTYLKRVENEDYFDKKTNFNPFKFAIN